MKTFLLLVAVYLAISYVVNSVTNRKRAREKKSLSYGSFPWPPPNQPFDGSSYVERLRQAGYEPPNGFVEGIDRLCREGGDANGIVGLLVDHETLRYSNPRVLADGINPEDLGSKDLSVIEHAESNTDLIRRLTAIGYLWELNGFYGGDAGSLSDSADANYVDRTVWAAWRLGWSVGEMFRWLQQRGLLTMVPIDHPHAPNREQVFLGREATIEMERLVRALLSESPPPVSWSDTGEHLDVTFAHTAAGDPIELGWIFERLPDGSLAEVADAKGTVSLPKNTALVLVPTQLSKFGSPLRGAPPDLFTGVEVVQGSMVSFGNDDIATLSPLAGLRELSIGFTANESLLIGHGSPHPFDDDALDIVGRFEHLDTLRLRSRVITDSGLGRLPHREFESLAFGNGAVSGESLGSLVGPATKKLAVEHTTIPFGECVWLTSTPQLEWLSLRQVGLDDAGIPPLAGLPLVHLDVALNSAEGRSKEPGSVGDRLARLAGDVATLRSVLMGSTDITDRGVAYLAELPELELLELWGTAITDESVRHLARSTTLRRLWLNGTNVTDSGLAMLEGLALTNLAVGDTAITDRCIDTILTLRHLEYLHLSDTDISFASLKRLKALPELRKLDLYIEDEKEIDRIVAALPGIDVGVGWF